MRPRTGHLFKRGDVYWIEYKIDGKRFQQSLETSSAREAKAKAAEKMAPYAARTEAERLAVVAARLKTAKDRAAAATAQESLLGAWPAFYALDKETRSDPGPATLAQYESHWNTFADWMEKNAPAVKTIADVRDSHAAAFIRHLNTIGLSVGRVNKYKRFLKMFFRIMLAGGENPFAAVRTQKDIQTAKQPFTVEELRAIVDRACGEMRTLYLLGAGTGLRLGDCCTLQWGEVDLARRLIFRVPNKTARKGETIKIGLPPTLAAHLGTLSRSGPYVLPELAAEYLAGRAPYIAKRIGKHLEDCGIQTVKPGTGAGSEKKGPDGKPIPGTARRAVVLKGFHSFRHSYVSLNADAGTPQATMQKLVGHGSPMMTLHYLTPSDAMVLKAADSLPPLLASGISDTKDPLPQWAIIALTKMTIENWRSVRSELLKGGRT